MWYRLVLLGLLGYLNVLYGQRIMGHDANQSAQIYVSKAGLFVNPQRHARAVRVTVVVGQPNSVCPSVCYQSSEGIAQFYTKISTS